MKVAAKSCPAFYPESLCRFHIGMNSGQAIGVVWRALPACSLCFASQKMNWEGTPNTPGIKQKTPKGLNL